MYLLEFEEISKELIWGGTSLAKKYSKPFDVNKNIGESWEISDLPNDNSVVSNGKFKGETLSSLVAKYKEKLLGTKCQEVYFPLLIKLIDARDKLSIQVHPDEEYANKKHNKHGKNEMWYVMEANENSKLLIGLKKDISISDLKKSVENELNIQNMFNYVDIKKGDAFFIPNGCIHAILGDVVIAEIQTPSDVTYRLYDWDRVDKEGNSRELHIEDSFNVIKDIDASTLKSDKKNIRKGSNLEINEIFFNQYFNVEEYSLYSIFSNKTNNETFEIIMVIEGEGIIKSDSENDSVNLFSGKTVLIPASLGNYTIEANNNIKFLRVTL